MSDACGCEKKNQFLAAGERCPSSKRAFRRKSPALAKKTLKEDSFEKDILRKKASPISCFEFRITPSESIDVESGDDFDPDVNQNFLNPATGVFEEEVYEDARSDFDKDILAQLNINYDLPSDPNARQSWINRVKNLNGARSKFILFIFKIQMIFKFLTNLNLNCDEVFVVKLKFFKSRKVTIKNYDET